MPTVQPDSVQTAPDTPVTIPVLANDSGTGLTITAVSTPGNGSVTVNPDQTVTYTPAPGFQGGDSFTYTVRDEADAFATGTVTVLVAFPNQPPSAVDDIVATTQGTAVTIPVLANDSDVDGDPFEIVAIGGPIGGTASAQPGGTVVYQPASGFTGTDSFPYTIRDARGGVASAIVRVDVTSRNRPPAAVDDLVVTTRDTPVRIAVLANDTDPEADPLILASVGAPANGRVAVEPDAAVLYTPDPGFVGIDGFAYTVSDGRGGLATGRVTIDVRRDNRAPTAQADSATTFANTPVSIPVLANDSDLDGDTLRVESVTVPAHGTLSIAADQSIVYTPAVGFTGTDNFSYTVGDGRGGRASGDVVITVQADPAATTYSNGYQFRRRIVVPSTVVGSNLTNFPLHVRLSGDWLKSQANGGKVRSNQGFDLRFEDSINTKLDHEIEAYDPVAGTLVAWVRVPTLTADSNTTIFLYYGKAGLAATEAAPAGVWRDYLAVWHLPSTTDRTGRGRNLTASNVGSGTLIGEAGSFSGTNSRMTLANTAFLNGHSAYTAQVWIKAAATGTDRGFLSIGPINGRDDAQAFCLRHDVDGFNGGGRNLILLEQAISDGRNRIESASNVQTTGIQMVAATWRQGQSPVVLIDGVPSTPTWAASPARSGTTALGDGTLQIGAASQDGATGGWVGQIDEVRFRATALTSAWLRAEHLNISEPRAFYGVGGEDQNVAGGNRAPVAIPDRVTTPRDTAITIDVRSNDRDPDADTMTLESVGAAVNGTVSIVSGQARFTPASGFIGTGSFEYVISDGRGGSSTGFVLVDVTVPASQPAVELPYANRLYGNPIHAEAVGNTRYTADRPVAFRFRAERSGTIEAVRWFNKYDVAGGNVGYSTGNGGRIRIDLRANAVVGGNNVPSATSLGSTAPQPRAIELGYFPIVEFLDPKPQVVAGQFYHLVFNQLDTSGANTISVNMLHTKKPIDLGGNGRFGPYWTDELAHLWYSGGTNGTWNVRADRAPIFELRYTDGVSTGQGMIFSHDSATKPVGGTEMARQIFTVRDATRTVAGLWMRVRRSGSSTPPELIVRLESSAGTLIEQLTVPAGAVPVSTIYDNPIPWIYRPFSQNRTLQLGQGYRVRFSAASAGYHLHAIQKGLNFGMQDRNIWRDAHAQYSVNSGASWVGWNFTATHLGTQTRTDMDLPIAFRVV